MSPQRRARWSRRSHRTRTLIGAERLGPGGREGPVGEADLARVGLGATLNTHTRHGPLDLAGAPTGAAPYAQLAARAARVSLGDIEIPIAGVDDLIAMRRAAGRDTDLRDIGELTRLD